MTSGYKIYFVDKKTLFLSSLFILDFEDKYLTYIGSIFGDYHQSFNCTYNQKSKTGVVGLKSDFKKDTETYFLGFYLKKNSEGKYEAVQTYKHSYTGYYSELNIIRIDKMRQILVYVSDEKSGTQGLVFYLQFQGKLKKLPLKHLFKGYIQTDLTVSDEDQTISAITENEGMYGCEWVKILD